MPTSIPQKYIDQYAKLQRLALNAATADGERANAARNLRDLESKYPGIAYEANKPTNANSDAPKQERDYSKIFSDILGVAQQAAKVVDSALGNAATAQWAQNNVSVQIRDSKNGRNLVIYSQIPIAELDSLMSRFPNPSSNLRTLSDTIGSMIAAELYEALAGDADGYEDEEPI